MCLVASWTSPAQAHLDLIKPVSRYGPDVLKTGPCGVTGGERSENINVYGPGQTIEVMWEEYVDHDGHYRIAFDADGDDDFVDPAEMQEYYSNDAVLLDQIMDRDAKDDPYYSTTITLPDIECENCTLQVIQVMYDKPPYIVPGNDIYYQCADLALREGADGGGPPRMPSDAGSEPDGGSTTGASGGGCTVAAGWTRSPRVLASLVVLVALVGVRRVAAPV